MNPNSLSPCFSFLQNSFGSFSKIQVISSSFHLPAAAVICAMAGLERWERRPEVPAECRILFGSAPGSPYKQWRAANSCTKDAALLQGPWGFLYTVDISLGYWNKGVDGNRGMSESLNAA